MSAADMFWAAPPISRTITAAAVLISVPAWMSLININLIIFVKQYVFTIRRIPEIWRLVSSFLLTSPKFGMILDPYFLYTYGSALETNAVRFSQPGDFFVYLVFVWAVILVLGGIWLNGFMLLSPLTLALAYTFAQENPTRQMSFFIITFAAKWLPYAMLAMTFVMDSPASAMIQATGLVAAHAYDFLTKIWPEYGGGRRIINTPEVVQRWFAQAPGTATQRGAGTAFSAQNVPQRPAGSGSGWASGIGGDAWRDRGQGRRLG